MGIFLPQNPGIGGIDELTLDEELFIQNLVSLGYASGDILYHNGTSITRLPKGDDGEVLMLTTGLPSWDNNLKNINSIQFDTTNTPLTNAEGLLQWNSTDGLVIGIDGGFINANDYAYNEGVLEDPTITDATGVAVSVTSVDCLIRSNATWDGDKRLYHKTVPENTALAMTDNSINYIYVTWNSGSPIYASTTDRDTLNNSDALPVARVWMSSGSIAYQMSYQYLGRGATMRNFDRVMRIRGQAGIERESGLTISETATRVINITSGYAWFGLSRKTLDAVAQGGVGVSSHIWYHNGGVWTEGVITAYNNTQYDDGTNIATLTANRYAVNWVFRNLVSNEIDIVLGTGDYTLAQAEASLLPALPEQILNFYVLCGRIIVQKSSDTAYAIENISTTAFDQATITIHNELSGLQGGTTGEYYHITSAQNTDLGVAKLPIAGGTMTGALIANDHGTATNAEVVGICYGTSEPPLASSTPIGTLYVKYIA